MLINQKGKYMLLSSDHKAHPIKFKISFCINTFGSINTDTFEIMIVIIV